MLAHQLFFACGSLQHFADLVAGHFRVHGHTILAACKYYLEGNAIGSVVPEDKEESGCFGDAGASSSNEPPKVVTRWANPFNKRGAFNAGLKTLFEDLLMEFNVKGADTRKFIAEKLKKNLPAA
jgi:ubiquitin-conjugating enzyme E2 O